MGKTLALAMALALAHGTPAVAQAGAATGAAIAAAAAALSAASAARAAAAAAQVSDSATVTIVPATNCPATAPPEAVAAGYTTLIKCWDGAAASMGDVNSWIEYPGNIPASPEWGGVMTASNNTLTPPDVIKQATDPLTGALVLDFHWPAGTPGYLKMTTDLTSDGKGDIEYAQGGLVEIKTRLTPLQTSGPCYPGPTFFSWHQYPPSNGVGAPAPLEDDYHEWYCGLHSDIADHDWGQWRQTSATADGAAGSNVITLTNVSGMPITTGAPGLPMTPQCVLGPPYPSPAFNANTSYFIWTYDPTTGTATLSSQEGALVPANLTAPLASVPIWLNSCADGWYPGDLYHNPVDVTAVNTYGMLTTTDGSSFIQKCGFLNHALITNHYNSPSDVNCGEFDFARETFHYTETKSFRWWIGGTSLTTDQYLYYIAVWGKPTCVPLGTDSTCAGTKNLPSPVVIQR